MMILLRRGGVEWKRGHGCSFPATTFFGQGLRRQPQQQQQQQQQQRRRRNASSCLVRRKYCPKQRQPGRYYYTQSQPQQPLPSLPPPPPPQQQQQGGSNDFFTFNGTLFSRGLMAVGMVYCFNEYVAEITLCEGPSMMPTLQPYGEIVLIDKFTLTSTSHCVNNICRGQDRIQQALKRQADYEAADPSHVDEWHEPKISVTDITTTQKPFFGKLLWPLLTTPLSIGDVVVLQHPNRKGTVCKRVLGLPGDTVVRPPPRGLLVIPDGHMWVEGDNPANSSDSRTYGAVPMALIQGRVLCRLWPLRGNAIMVRGAPPRPPPQQQQLRPTTEIGYTILPAGYEGQHIVKTLHKVKDVKSNTTN